MPSPLLHITPVLPSADIARDVAWYRDKTGFEPVYEDKMYAVICREHLYIHLQWHADTDDDPLLGGSVIRIAVSDVMELFREFVERGTVQEDAMRLHTPWETHEFGFYDLNNNAVFVAQDIR